MRGLVGWGQMSFSVTGAEVRLSRRGVKVGLEMLERSGIVQLGAFEISQLRRTEGIFVVEGCGERPSMVGGPQHHRPPPRRPFLKALHIALKNSRHVRFGAFSNMVHQVPATPPPNPGSRQVPETTVTVTDIEAAPIDPTQKKPPLPAPAADVLKSRKQRLWR